MNVDIGKPWTWIKYRSALCDTCRASCCSLPVEVTKEDLVQLGVITEEEAQGSLKKVARRLEKEKIATQFRARTGLFMLGQSPNGDCLYLDANRRCTVYEKRPSVCRKFPTELGPRIDFCPAIKKN